MKITALYVYPIKALRGIELGSASIGPQGIRHDRRFMMYEVNPSTDKMKKIQLDSHPRCALFEQAIVQDSQGEDSAVVLRFLGTKAQEANESEDDEPLRVPLSPDLSSLTKIEVELHNSPATAYRMGSSYDRWLSERLGVEAMLVYIGDGRRAVLGKTLPPEPVTRTQQGGWMSSLASYITKSEDPAPSLAFSDVAPLLVASESSLHDVRDRFLGGHPVGMFKFRPNIVVDGESEGAWAEDFWAELVITTNHAGSENGDESLGSVLQLTGNCVRCTSLNVDYTTGKPGEGEEGSVLKSLMKERRVDTGAKWSPVFGRYAFLDRRHAEGVTVSVGDGVQVTRRNAERSVWDWPGS